MKETESLELRSVLFLYILGGFPVFKLQSVILVLVRKRFLAITFVGLFVLSFAALSSLGGIPKVYAVNLCSPGYYGAYPACTPCPPGYYQPFYGQLSCVTSSYE
jgi:hypothetical protein